MKKLSIIIPRYKETEQDIFPLLTSILNQLAVRWSDIEIIIVNDGGGAGPLDSNFLSIFGNIDIYQVDLAENYGPGVARQTGIDEAEGEYLMFCDADDTLHNVGVLSAILDETKSTQPDILITKWLEEVKGDDGKMLYVTHDTDWTWMHGKVIRREFIIESGVRHHPDLRVHEDSYFLNRLSAHDGEFQTSDLISYVWKWRNDSITRRNNGEYTYNSLPTFLYAVGQADAEIVKINEKIMPERIAYRVCYVYHMVHSDDWQTEEHVVDVKNAEDALVENVGSFWNYWRDATTDIRKAQYVATTAFSGGAILSETLPQWLERLGLEY